MPLTRFAMIIKAKSSGYQPAEHTAVFSTPTFSTTIVCVSTVDQALVEAGKLVEQGIQLIELCGGFSLEDKDRLSNQIQCRIPVGVVRYSPEEQSQLAKLFGGPS